MSKYKYLLKNIGLLTISNFGTKILSFLLIPIYTSILSTADYGTYDVYSTTVSLLVPILTLNIVEAVMRFALDGTKNKKEVFSIGLKQIVVAILIVVIIATANWFFNIISIFNVYPSFFVLLFGFSLLYDFLIQFSRGVEHIGDVAIAGALNAFAVLGLNIFFLVFLKWGLNGYFAANILSYLIPSLYIMFRLRIWKYFTNNYDHALEREMYSYSKPLIFNTLAWWINNVSDRYIVTWLCGVAANGIYSMAYKIPSVLNIFQSIFSQAWTISAVKEFNESGTDFYCKVYKAYNCGMVIICSALIVVDKVLAKFLFAKDFYIAWRYAPFLMISVVFGALSGLLGGIFSAAKKSKIFASTTMIGASVNTVLNVGLVYLWGPVGAAIATAISYCLVWLARYKKANEIIHLSIAFKRDVFSYCILVIQACFLILTDGTAMYGVEILLFMVVLIVYAKDIFNMYDDVRIKFDEKNKLNEN